MLAISLGNETQRRLGLAKHSLYTLSNLLALSHQLADPNITTAICQTLASNRAVKQLLQLHQPRISDDLAKVYAVDYQTKKELLVFVYYLCEYNDSSILKQSLLLNENEVLSNGSCILDEYEKVLLIYQSSDPYLVQVALSVMSLVSQLCQNLNQEN